MEVIFESYTLRKKYNEFCVYLMRIISKQEIQVREKDKMERLSSIGYPMKSIILYILNATFLSSKRIKQNVLANNPLN